MEACFILLLIKMKDCLICRNPHDFRYCHILKKVIINREKRESRDKSECVHKYNNFNINVLEIIFRQKNQAHTMNV